MTVTASPVTSATQHERPHYWKRFRGALWLLTVRDLKVRYTTDALGYLWSIIDPLLMAAIYFVVFTVIFHRGNTSEDPYIVFLLAGMLPWNWFSGNIGDATKAFRSEGKLVRSVKIPRTIWILRQISSKGIEFLLSLPVIVFFAIINNKAASSATVIYLPLAILLQLTLTVGLSFIIAPLAVFMTDMNRIVKLILRAGFYASPVLYHLDVGHPLLHLLYGLNPTVGMLDLYRGCFFPDNVDWTYVIQSAILSLIIFAIGCVVFRRNVPNVLKEI